jgi:xanthosine utilization system XapX-like protein
MRRIAFVAGFAMLGFVLAELGVPIFALVSIAAALVVGFIVGFDVGYTAARRSS